jgi:hypothetical protein
MGIGNGHVSLLVRTPDPPECDDGVRHASTGNGMSPAPGAMEAGDDPHRRQASVPDG